MVREGRRAGHFFGGNEADDRKGCRKIHRSACCCFEFMVRRSEVQCLGGCVRCCVPSFANCC